MNKKQYFLLTLLLSCTAHQTLQAVTVPLKTLVVTAVGLGLFAAEVSKTKGKAAELLESEKSRLQRTHPRIDATLQTASELLTATACYLEKVALHVEAKRKTLPDEIEELGNTLTASVKPVDADTQAGPEKAHVTLQAANLPSEASVAPATAESIVEAPTAQDSFSQVPSVTNE